MFRDCIKLIRDFPSILCIADIWHWYFPSEGCVSTECTAKQGNSAPELPPVPIRQPRKRSSGITPRISQLEIITLKQNVSFILSKI